jgi:hypothetical protein
MPIDAHESDDWRVLDEYIAENFISHNPPIPGVTLDRDGMKLAAEIFRVATPGDHEIKMRGGPRERRRTRRCAVCRRAARARRAG